MGAPLSLTALLAHVLISAPSGASTAPLSDPVTAEIASTLATDTETFLPFRGRPVVGVDVVAPPGNDPADLRQLIDIQPGYLLMEGDVQAAIKRLYALGRFSQIEVNAETLGGSVVLHVIAHPLRRLNDVIIRGTKVASNDGLRAALGISIGDEVDGRTHRRVTSRAMTYLHRSGLVHAQLDVQRFDNPELGLVDFHLRIKEGEPRRISQLRFSGDKRLPAAVLSDAMQSREGGVLDLATLAQDRESLRALYYDHGFMQVTVGEPEIVEADDTATVAVSVNAGDRIAIEFTGNRLLSDSALRALWPDPKGGPTQTNLRIFQQRIISHYERLGYGRATTALRAARDSARRIRHYLIEIDENVPVQVTAVRFVGAVALPQELLVEQVTGTLVKELQADDIFTPLTPIEMDVQPQPYGAAPATTAEIIAPQSRWVPELYEEAVQQIGNAYRDLGYLSAELGRPHLVGECPRAQALKVCALAAEIEIKEGPQTFVNSISLGGNSSLPASELLQVVHDATSRADLAPPLTPGAPLSQNAVEDGRIDIIRRYRDLGHLYVRVFSKVDLADGNPWANVHYTIEEGPQVRVQRVLVRGNRFTREGIIRSRIAMRSGDLYRLEAALADQRSVSILGTFSSVRVKLLDEEHPAERKDVVADVTERNRQPIELAPGVSTAYGPRLRASYSHLNVLGTASVFTASLKVNRQIFFDFFGGYADLLRQRYNSYTGIEQLTRALEREIRFGLRSPPIRLLPFDPVLRLDLVDQRVNAVRYSFNSEVAIFGIDMVLPARFKASLEAQGGFINLECEESIDPNCNQSPDLRRLQSVPIDVGQRWTLKGGPLLVWDYRDSRINPTRGLFSSGRFTYAFGEATPGNKVPYLPFAFIKYEGNVTGYVPLWGPVLAISVRGGTINLLRSQVPIDERFFLGGRDTLRGFVESTLIPQDACVGNADTLPAGCAEQIAQTPGYPPLSRGGNTYLLIKTELRVPLRNNISVDIFADVGNLWVDLLRTQRLGARLGTGVGIRYATPVGALTIDIGVNPMPRREYREPWWQLHFSIGSF